MPGCDCHFAEEVGTIPTTTRVIMLVGRQDSMVRERFATTDVERDDAGAARAARLRPPDGATSTARPAAGRPLDAGHGRRLGPARRLDWYGTWKFFDALTDCSFDDTGCDAALGNTPEQRFMGIWSDGTPVTEAEITDDPLRRPAFVAADEGGSSCFCLTAAHASPPPPS